MHAPRTAMPTPAPRSTLLPPLCAALLAAAALPALAQSSAAAGAAASGQVIEPEVARPEVVLPRYPARDFELSLYLGTYSAQNFGAHPVGGLRLAYHITEDFFVEASAGASQVKDDNYRQILPGGIFENGSSTLSYYSLSAGMNVLPGEVFVGSKRALASNLYLLAGTGSTHFAGQKQQTFHYGTGMRIQINNRWAVRVDMRDHVYSLDLLGKRQSTHNLELTFGGSFVF